MGNQANNSFKQRMLELISETGFIRFTNIISEPNFFSIVGRTHYERWHSCFFGWLLDTNGSHLMREYVLKRCLLLLFDNKCLKSIHHENSVLPSLLPTIEFENTEVTPNEFISSEISVKDIGRFDIFLTCDYHNFSEQSGRINILFELKIDSVVDRVQSKKYADWLYTNHPSDINLLIYILPKLEKDSVTTVGDSRWYCMDYQLINDKLLFPLLDHPNLNHKVQPFIIQYIKNLKTRYRGIKMAITNEEKNIAIELYEKYSDVFDSIYDALQESNIIDYSTSEISAKGRKSGRMAITINGSLFEADMVRILFKKILIYLVDSQLLERIPLPWGVGNTRYIVTNDPIPKHPNGRDFFYPESFKGYTIETHYGRDRAISILDHLCKKLEIDFEQVEV